MGRQLDLIFIFTLDQVSKRFPLIGVFGLIIHNQLLVPLKDAQLENIMMYLIIVSKAITVFMEDIGEQTITAILWTKNGDGLQSTLFGIVKLRHLDQQKPALYVKIQMVTM